MTDPSVVRLGPQEKARALAWLQDPGRWPLRPFLPVVRRAAGRADELGVVFDARAAGLHGFDCTVFLTNLFLVPDTVGELLALPRRVYDTWDEVLAAGWSID